MDKNIEEEIDIKNNEIPLENENINKNDDEDMEIK